MIRRRTVSRSPFHLCRVQSRAVLSDPHAVRVVKRVLSFSGRRETATALLPSAYRGGPFVRPRRQDRSVRFSSVNRRAAIVGLLGQSILERARVGGIPVHEGVTATNNPRWSSTRLLH